MRRFLFSASAALLLCFTAAAHADTTFNFTLTSLEYNGSGTLTGVPDLISGAYDITSATGTISGTPVTLLFTAGLNSSNSTTHFPTGNYDNVVYLNGSPAVDLDGLLFIYGAATLNVFYAGDCCGIDAGSTAGAIDNAVFTVTPATTPPVPEPSAFILLGTGVLSLAGTARRKFLKA